MKNTTPTPNRSLMTIVFIAVLAPLLLSACGMGQVIPADSPDEVAQRLDPEIQNLMSRYRVPGAAVALIHDGDVTWVQGYGVADKETGTPITPETVFQAASVSKAVSAWGVMKLVEEGKLDLDAPVEQYLTRWHLPPSEFDNNQVTVRRLLSHTAGTSVGGYLGFDPGQEVPTLEEVLSGEGVLLGDMRVEQAPGSGWSYSGGGYTLLQLVVEEVTGESFANYMKQEILNPLGMPNSSFEWTPDLLTRMATGYDWLGRPVPNYRFRAEAAASLSTTPSEMALFVAATMPGPDGEPVGRGVLEPDTLDLMLSPAPATDGAFGGMLQNGLGYMLVPGDTLMAFHGGDNRGWKAMVFTMPEMREGLVILTNSDRAQTFGFQMELLCAWSELLPRNPAQGMCEGAKGPRNMLRTVAAVLGLGLVSYGGWVVARLRAGRLRLGWEFSWRRILRIVLLAAGIALWWVFWYTGLIMAIAVPGWPEHFLPVTFLVPWPTAFAWISWAVSLWGVALIATTFAPRVKRQPSTEAAPS